MGPPPGAEGGPMGPPPGGPDPLFGEGGPAGGPPPGDMGPPQEIWVITWDMGPGDQGTR